jgi:hypothetical protein
MVGWRGKLLISSQVGSGNPLESIFKIFVCYYYIGGVQPWDLKIPPRINMFLWLLSQAKNMTRDNLSKRYSKTLRVQFMQ